MSGPEILIPIAFFFSVTTIIRTFVKARERRFELEAHRYGGDPDVSLRLDRMEQAIEAMAVEVERVAEAQHFTTRLLSERSGMQVPEAQHRLP
jgi:hypothetical protein